MSQEQAREQCAIMNLPNIESTSLNQERAREQSKVTTRPYKDSDSTMENQEETNMNHTIMRKFEMLARMPMLYTFPFTHKQAENISRGDSVFPFTHEQVLFLCAYNPTVRPPTEFNPKIRPPTEPKHELQVVLPKQPPWEPHTIKDTLHKLAVPEASDVDMALFDTLTDMRAIESFPFTNAQQNQVATQKWVASFNLEQREYIRAHIFELFQESEVIKSFPFTKSQKLQHLLKLAVTNFLTLQGGFLLYHKLHAGKPPNSVSKIRIETNVASLREQKINAWKKDSCSHTSDGWMSHPSTFNIPDSNVEFTKLECHRPAVHALTRTNLDE